MRADFERLFTAWDALTQDYLRSRAVDRPITQSVKNRAWLAYKTRESELIRRHGWTLLEFEREMSERFSPRVPVGVM